MATIRNFGHYWSRELIDWGWKGSAESLLGAVKVGAEESDVDFRCQIGIYVQGLGDLCLTFQHSRSW